VTPILRHFRTPEMNPDVPACSRARRERGATILVATTLAALTALGCSRGRQEAPSPAPAPSAGAPAAAPVGSAQISGRIRYEGPPVPSPVAVEMSPECRALNTEGLMRQPVRVQDGGVADAVVYVKGPSGAYPASSQPVVLDQKGCAYTPASVAVQIGQPLLVRNSDATMHNVHLRPNVNRDFNTSQPQKGMESTQTFDKEEALMPVGCDVHPWMRAHISVFSHPFFAVSGPSGTYEIKSLPAGTYEIEAVHPRLKPVTGKVTVKDGGSTTLDLAFKG
jgi:plastocyanin